MRIEIDISRRAAIFFILFALIVGIGLATSPIIGETISGGAFSATNSSLTSTFQGVNVTSINSSGNANFTGGVNVTSINASGAVNLAGGWKISGAAVTASAAQLNYDDATSSIQTQLNGKQASLGYTAENTANKNSASGYAGLDGSSHLTPSQVNFFMTQSVVTGSRAIGTVYQNTGTKPMFVIVTATSTTSGAGVNFYTDSSASPSTIVFQGVVPSGNSNGMAFGIVEPNNYYKVTVTVGTPGLLYWTEWS